MKKLIIFCSILFVSQTSWSYIPRFDYVINRTADVHGSGIYLIDQDVTLIGTGQSPITLHEQWLVSSGKLMRMKLTGRNEWADSIRKTVIYNDKQQYSVNSQGKKTIEKRRDDFLESFFYFRSTSYLKSLLYNWNIIPRKALADPPRLSRIEEIRNDPEDFVSLSRSGGKVSYKFQIKDESHQKSPAMWIEQDYFHILRLRTPTEAEIIADNYQHHRNNLWLPQIREIRWGEQKAVINVTQVKYLGQSSSLKKRLSASSLDTNKEPELKEIKPENIIVNEFYSRFR
ncbi:MAG: hypothetical protein KDD58_02800 [Bdellovibrionales bacterium]|nr:hypothetical protein [Bdellovibrionales bacterium]